MAFSSTIAGRTILGNKRLHFGTFNAASVTTGDIETGLITVESAMITHKGSAVETDVGTITDTLPVAGNEITIKVNDSDTGYWLAIGH